MAEILSGRREQFIHEMVLLGYTKQAARKKSMHVLNSLYILQVGPIKLLKFLAV